MSTHPRDLLFYGGGECLQRFGTLVWRPRLAHDAVPTFTRTGTARLIGSSGVLRSSSANRPRVSWPLVDGVRTPSLLLEAAGTNELLRSEELDNASWTKTAASVTANQAVGPDGATTLDEIVEDGTTAIHRVEQGASGLTANASFALSGYFRANTRTWVRLLMFETAAPANTANAWFNLSTGAVGTTGATGTAALDRAYVEDCGNGLYRCVLVASVGNSATAVTGSVRMATGDNVGSYAGDGSSSIYGGYVQIEDDTAVATSYIPTTTAAATRSAETFDVPISFGPQALTGYIKLFDSGAARRNDATFAGDLLTLGRTTSGNGFVQIDNPDATSFRVISVGAGGEAASRGGISATDRSTLEIAFQVDADFGVAAQYAVDGGSTSTLATVTNADGLPSSWAADFIRLHREATYSVKVASGTKTLAEMRSIFPRAAS